MNPEQLMTELASIAREAGRAILNIYDREFDVSFKDDHSPLTEADLASHVVIRDDIPGWTDHEPGSHGLNLSLQYATALTTEEEIIERIVIRVWIDPHLLILRHVDTHYRRGRILDCPGDCIHPSECDRVLQGLIVHYASLG